MAISSSPTSSIANMARTYSQIASVTLGTGSSTITFTSIPSTYTDLIMTVSANQETSTSGYLRFNSDSSTNYSYRAIYYNDVTTQSLNQGAGCLVTNFGSLTAHITSIINIMSYASSSRWKTVLARCSGSGGGIYTVSNWASTSAINTITLLSGSGNWRSGSIVSLFGIKKA